MRGFTTALGVRCGHCHIEPVAGERDYSADDKPAKNVARAMMRMVAAINNEYLAEHEVAHDAGGEHAHSRARVQVQCVTCNRGQEHPYLLADRLLSVRDESGLEAAVARYHELRDQYYGSHTYDFSVGSLNGLAERLMANDQVTDALAILELNAESFAESKANCTCT